MQRASSRPTDAHTGGVIWAIRTLIWFAALTICLVALATYLPQILNRVQVPPDYDDIGGLKPMDGVWLTAPPWFAGDTLAYRIGDGPEDIGFGTIAGMPGDKVQIVAGELQVDDAGVSGWKPYYVYDGMLDVGPLIVPANHYFVISNQHQRDSLPLGVISSTQVFGKVKE